MPRLLCAIAAAQASLCLSDNAGMRRRATRGLIRELDRQVLPDGCHIARNPQAILELLLDLLPLRQSYQARNIAPPQEVISAVDRLMPMLRFFRHVDGSFATFNGMGYTQAHLIATLLTYDDARGKPVQNAPHGGYQRIDGGGSVVLVDTGKPPPLTLSGLYHPVAHGSAALALDALGEKFERPCRLELADQVDAIQQRSAQPALIAAARTLVARAVLARACAGARVAGSDEHDRGGEAERALPAGDVDLARLERLAERLQRGSRELRELVEEQHAAVSEGYLPRPRRRSAA